MNNERRFIEQRASTVSLTKRDDSNRTIRGYAAVFYRAGDASTEFRLYDNLVERIGRGAFDRALSEKHDVRGLFNHDASLILGRTSAGTMRLSVDETGLRYEIDVPETQAGRDLFESIARGDISGSSFGFLITRTTWFEDKDLTIRLIEDLELLDAGPVTFPAYKGASTGI